MTTRRTITLLVLAVAAGAVAGRLTGGAPGTLTLAGLVALALLVSAFVPSVRKADPPEVAGVPAPTPEPRRRPIAPPPTLGHWDEAPRA